MYIFFYNDEWLLIYVFLIFFIVQQILYLEIKLLCYLCSQFIRILFTACTVIYRKCVLNIQYVIPNVKTLKRNLVGIGPSFSAALYNSSTDCASSVTHRSSRSDCSPLDSNRSVISCRLPTMLVVLNESNTQLLF